MGAPRCVRAQVILVIWSEKIEEPVVAARRVISDIIVRYCCIRPVEPPAWRKTVTKVACNA